MKLNPEQATASRSIGQLRARGEIDALLIGPAGSGKTSTIAELARIEPDRLGLAAPTHQAARVLSRTLRDHGIGAVPGFRPRAYRDSNGDLCQGDRIEVGTAASLLGMAPAETADGQEILRPRYANKAPEFAAVVFDECSMLDKVTRRAIRSGCSDVFTIYAGDPHQLPPVNEQISACFTEVPPERRFELRQVMRQAAGSQILDVAMELRGQQTEGRFDMAWTEGLPPYQLGEPGVFGGTIGDAVDLFRQAGRFDPDLCRVLGYHNRTTIEHGRAIRDALLGSPPTPFVRGEFALLRSPLIRLTGDRRPGEEFVVTVSVSTIVEVQEIWPEVVTFDAGGASLRGDRPLFSPWRMPIDAWRMRVRVDGEDYLTAIPRDPGLRENLLTRLTAKRRYDDRTRLRALLADLRDVYSSTTHTAQGLTLGTVFLDLGDIVGALHPTALDKLRLIYTAATRARHALVVLREPTMADFGL